MQERKYIGEIRCNERRYGGKEHRKRGMLEKRNEMEDMQEWRTAGKEKCKN